jgi:hypothetical protein
MDPSLVLDVTRLPTPLKTDRDTAFGYAQWRVQPSLTLHGGADYVRFGPGRSQAERINGKLGRAPPAAAPPCGPRLPGRVRLDMTRKTRSDPVCRFQSGL